MASEARRGLVRIGSNYGRLLATLAIGVALTPIQFAWLGNEAFGLIVLLGAGMGLVGLAALFQDVIRNGMVRELGDAYHSGDDQHFRRVYNSSYLICGVAALLAALTFGLILLVLPLLKIRPDLLGPARIFTASEGVYTCIMILLAPPFNLYVVSERFVAANVWTAAKRATYLLAAVVLFYGMGITDPPLALTLFGVVPAVMNIALLLVSVGIIMWLDRRLVPAPSLARWETARTILPTFGWNSGVILAINLHERVGGFIVNIAFGLGMNAVFGLALRLVSYVRMATLGMTFGLDAVSARISSNDDPEALRRLVRHTTRLHAFAAMPATLAIVVVVQPLLEVWVGGSMEDPATNIPLTVTLVRIMAVGLAARAISDCWIKILYGAGHVQRVAPLIVAGGLANPAIAALLFFVLPAGWKFTCAAWGITLVFTLIHLLVLPLIGAGLLRVSLADLFGPLVRPLTIALVCLPLLWAVRAVAGGWSLAALTVAAALYSAAYTALSFVFVLDATERKWFVNAALRRVAPSLRRA